MTRQWRVDCAAAWRGRWGRDVGTWAETAAGPRGPSQREQQVNGDLLRGRWTVAGLDGGPGEVERSGQRVKGADSEFDAQLDSSLRGHRDPPVINTIVYGEQLQPTRHRHRQHHLWSIIIPIVICLRQTIQASGGIMFSGCPSVRPFVRPSFRSSVTKLVNMIFWKWMNRFWCQLAQVVRGARTWSDQRWGQEVKVQGQTRLKIYLEAWRRLHSRPLGSGRFSILCPNNTWLRFR